MIYFFRKGNTVVEYKSKRELCQNVDFYDIIKVGITHSYIKSMRHYGEIALSYLNRLEKLSPHSKQISFKNGKLDFETTGWNIYDELGQYYSIIDFIDFYEKENDDYNQKYWNKKYGKWAGVGTVPGIGRKNGYYSRIKYPKTYNEIRQNEIIKENEEPVARVSRQSYNIPTSWDDIRRTGNKNWKRYRNKQYK